MTAYIDLYLRADTEDDLIAAIPWARGEDESGEPVWRTGGDGWALDIIGPVTGDDRCHANLRVRMGLDELVASIPSGIILDPPPATPMRVWL